VGNETFLGVAFSDATARGAVRVLKRRLHERWTALDRALAWRGAQDDVGALVYRGSPVGKQRALKRLKAIYARHGARLQSVHLEGKDPLVLWAVLKARGSLFLGVDDPSLTQNCVTVDYWLVMRNRERGVARGADGMWTIEAQDHALCRLAQRTRVTDPAALEGFLWEAHRYVLGLPEQIPEPGISFLVPAGPGGFVCEFSYGCDYERNDRVSLHVRAITWVHRDQFYADQVPPALARPDAPSLGGTWLLPYPLRRITHDGTRMTLHALAGERC